MRDCTAGTSKIMKSKKPKKKLSPKQRANQIEREYYRGAAKEAHPKWQDVWKEVYGG